MTAHRPRQQRHTDDPTLVEVLLSGAYAPGTGWLVARRSHVWRPPTDIYETDEAIIVRMEIAGMRQDEFSISFQNRRLLITGTRFQPSIGPRAYHQMEVNFGDFRVEIEMPSAVTSDEIQAEYQDGFLQITLPKPTPRRVEIK